MIAAIVRFLEERTGLPSAISRALDQPPRFSALGQLLGVLFLLQLGTGFALALHYSPSATDAWGSVWFIENRLLGGSLIRGVHHWGTSVLVVALGIHVLATALAGGYRRPREISWWLSLALVGVVLAFGMTGNPLPWDQHGFWGARVESGIMGAMPVVGPTLQRLFLGGNDLGNLTLTRFFAIHAIALPAVLLALLALKWIVAGREGRVFARNPRAVALVLVPLAVGAVVALAMLVPPGLEAPAEPAVAYQALPAWYFLPLNQLLTILPGLLGSAVVPGIATLFLLAVPFLDRGPSLRLAARLPWVGGIGVFGVGVIGLLAMGLRHETEDAPVVEARSAAREDADRATVVAANGIPPDGAAAMMAHDPLTRGKRIFAQQCAPCHLVGGKGNDDPNGPDLAGYLSQGWLEALLRDPQDHRFFGTTKIDEMDAYGDREPAELAKAAGFLRELRKHPGVDPDELPEELASGREAFDDLECSSCHELAPEEEGGAPNLNGYGSDEWLTGFLRHPDAELYYGEGNEMPSFEPHELTDEDVTAVITWLRHLETRPLAPEGAKVAKVEKPDAAAQRE